MRRQDEITKMLVEITSLHGYSVGSHTAKESEIEYRKGLLAALRWVLQIDKALPIM